MIKIQIEETDHGHKFINIYEVRTMNHELETNTVDIYLNEEEAKKYAKFIEERDKNIYIKTWIRKKIVWC